MTITTAPAATTGTWSLFDLATGQLLGRSFSGQLVHLQANTPPGCAAVAGVHNHTNRRVDLDTGEVVPWQPPAPPADQWQTWAWDSTAERWAATPTLAALQRTATAPVLAAITAAESAQARPLRELAMASATGATPPAAALQRLADLDTQITTLRAVLAAIASAADAPALAAITWS